MTRGPAVGQWPRYTTLSHTLKCQKAEGRCGRALKEKEPVFYNGHHGLQGKYCASVEHISTLELRLLNCIL